ncbi:hypothetical protein BJY00DRAFT_59252 [Aspergillus carlsbadensis]|nr:hypothetical protein BJY00DRAFT_59252 [Aspergillus carlsbadensis]
MALQKSILEHPIPLDTQEAIAVRFWGSKGFKLEHLAPYFQYYTEQCRIIYLSLKSSLPLKTHCDILEIASDVLSGLPRSEVKESLVARYTNLDQDSEEIVDACIDLTVRLVFMLDVGHLRNTFTGRPKLVWGTGSIHEFMRLEFPESHSNHNSTIRLQKGFHIYNMVRIAGFRIELTTNLLEHLQLRDQDQTVTIFHHASFLHSQQGSPLFPKGFIDETLATLALLFPQGNRNARKWYNSQLSPDELDPNILKCGSAQRRIHRYKYWHDRLVVLKEEFDESKPSTLSQWWNDRREGTQWYTLWVAISFTLLFGLIQTVVGILQLYKAYYPST